MQHKTNVRLVDSHAEGYGSNDDPRLIPDKKVLVALTLGFGQTCVVREGEKPFGDQSGAQVIDLLSGKTINDARFGWKPVQKVPYLAK